jgi:hypothetical protein
MSRADTIESGANSAAAVDELFADATPAELLSMAVDENRDAWIALRMPVAVAELAARDANLILAMSGALLLTDRAQESALIAAWRTNDDAELGRLFRKAVDDRLAHAVELSVEERAFELFPEGGE